MINANAIGDHAFLERCTFVILAMMHRERQRSG